MEWPHYRRYAGEVVQVVAGVLERDGRVLICRRKTGSWHALKWEFPGGKVNAGEQPAQALARELEEELGIHARIGEEMARTSYQYPGRTPIDLMFFRVAAYEGEPANLDFEEIRWEQPARLAQYDFLEGDLEFVRRLAATSPAV